MRCSPVRITLWCSRVMRLEVRSDAKDAAYLSMTDLGGGAGRGCQAGRWWGGARKPGGRGPAALPRRLPRPGPKKRALT
jgi:hypothetical protein